MRKNEMNSERYNEAPVKRSCYLAALIWLTPHELLRNLQAADEETMVMFLFLGPQSILNSHDPMRIWRDT